MIFVHKKTLTNNSQTILIPWRFYRNSFNWSQNAEFEYIELNIGDLVGTAQNWTRRPTFISYNLLIDKHAQTCNLIACICMMILRYSLQLKEGYNLTNRTILNIASELKNSFLVWRDIAIRAELIIPIRHLPSDITRYLWTYMLKYITNDKVSCTLFFNEPWNMDILLKKAFCLIYKIILYRFIGFCGTHLLRHNGWFKRRRTEWRTVHQLIHALHIQSGECKV